MGKLGTMKVKQNMINKTPKETLITSPAMIVEKNATMRVTVNDIHRQK